MKKTFLAFLWIYPLLFILDGSLSLIDDITSYFLPVKILSSVREILANTTLFLSMPYIFTLFFFKTKKPAAYWILPAYNIIFTVVSSVNLIGLVSTSSFFTLMALAVSPHWIYINHPIFFICQLCSSVVQLGIGIYSFRSTWAQRAEVERKEARYFLGGFAVFSFAGFYIATNIILLIVLFVSSSAGFLGFNGDQIISVEKVYEKNGKIVHFIPMIHVGSKEFYEELSKLDATKKTLILLEGVSDEKKLMQKISYKKMASSIGLDEQVKYFKPLANTKELQKNVSYLISDVDASQFNPETRTFINKIMKEMDEKSFFEMLLVGGGDMNVPGGIANLSVDLIEKRNQKVIDNLASNEAKFEEFYIPWGAMHLPELERAILKMGYKEISKKERPVFSVMAMLSKSSK
jgi:transcription termination factor NusB